MGAEKGTLALMVGGDVAAMERARPALEVLGTVYHCGTVGAGQIVKLANNAISMTTFAIIEEARAMARAHGADMSQLMKIIGQSTGRSFVQASRHSNHGTRGETGRKERWVISRPLLLLRLRGCALRTLARVMSSAARSLMQSRAYLPTAASMGNSRPPIELPVSMDWSRTTRSTVLAAINRRVRPLYLQCLDERRVPPVDGGPAAAQQVEIGRAHV